MIECKLENSNVRNLRHVTVSVIAINEKAEVLLIKRAPDVYEGGKYTVPGGFLERGEDSYTAALRMLENQTGYFGRTLTLFQINDSPVRMHEDRQNIDFVYVIDITGGVPTPGDGIVGVEWFAFDKLPGGDAFAFDHRKAIESYFQYQNKQFPLPIMGKLG